MLMSTGEEMGKDQYQQEGKMEEGAQRVNAPPAGLTRLTLPIMVPVLSKNSDGTTETALSSPIDHRGYTSDQGKL